MAWASSLGRYAASIPRRSERARRALGKTGQRVARSRARKNTGEMRNRIEYQDRIDALVASAPQTRFNEFGTRYMSAQPMLRPGFAVMAKDAGDEYERAFE